MEYFLVRQVQTRNNRLFVCYGGYRFYAPKNTKARKGMYVMLHRHSGFVDRNVFWKSILPRYENWGEVPRSRR